MSRRDHLSHLDSRVLLGVLALLGCGSRETFAGSRGTPGTGGVSGPAGPDGPNGTGGNGSAGTDGVATDGSAAGGEDTRGALLVVPACTIIHPIVSATHPALNGVPATEGGDRASAPGAPYQVSFEVRTDVADGQLVELDLDALSAPALVTTMRAESSGGRAIFPAVALSSGVSYEAQARCLDETGGVGLSSKNVYPVDTTPPDLTISTPKVGAFLGPADLTAGALSVCGSTTAPDAINLDAALGARAANFCVAAGGFRTCTPAHANTCVGVPCPGNGAFDITVTLTDAAGNPQEQAIKAVTCYSTSPSVRVVSPLSGGPGFTNPTGRLLAANAAQALRDQDAATDGAQTNVVICSNRAGTLTLVAGHKGDVTLVPAGTPLDTRAAVGADGCPAGLGFAATFAGVTLPESLEAADTTLTTATELMATIVDLSGTKNSSTPVDLWVDSVAPVLLLTAPVDLCGSYHQASGGFFSVETVTSTAPNVTLILTNSTSSQDFKSTTFSTVTFPFVGFAPGQTFLTGVATDGAGNVGALQPSPCVVTVGTDPP
jgi:hypothetical protein